MIERIYVIEDADIELFVGVNRSNLITLGNLYPRTKIRQQGNILKILAEQAEGEALLSKLEQLEQLCVQHNQLTEQQIIETVRGRNASHETKPRGASSLILYGLHGKGIYARGSNQHRLVEAFAEHDLCLATGPAGSGKTFIAICLAVKALKSKQVRRIILSRPAVEAGEKLGFLPGEMKDKLDPYLQPLYDALGELIPATKLKDYLDTGVIQIAPLAFMRGRTLNDAVIILDEAQNTTPQQMKMFLTRLGNNAKMIVTGDISQIDLPRGIYSGLRDAINKLSALEGVGIVGFEASDIVRHPLVQRIVEVYDQKEGDNLINEQEQVKDNDNE